MRSRFLKLPRLVSLAFVSGVAGLVMMTTMSTPAGADDSTFYKPVPAVPASAEVVHLGVEPISFDNVSPNTDSFDTSFYVWWRWKGPIDPAPTTDVYNATGAESFFVESYSYTNPAGQEKPTKLADGDFYQTAKISVGVGDPFNVSRYPLDHQILTIRLENNTYDFDQLVYVPDTQNLSPNPDFDVAGWNINGEGMDSFLHQYETNFGVLGQGVAAQQYSQITYNVQISRPVPHFIWKLLLPMIVVLLAVFGALFVMEDKTDVRLIIVGTGLLTLIFLQQSYSTDLPATSPVVLMDLIYASAYVAVGATFIRTVYTANMIHHHENDRHNYIKTDRIAALAIAAAFAVAVIVLIAS